MSERERFEAWASEPPRDWSVRRYPDKSDTYTWYGEYKQFYVQTAWESWQARCPEAYSVVPNKITKEIASVYYRNECLNTAQEIHSEMLDAAPQPGNKS